MISIQEYLLPVKLYPNITRMTLGANFILMRQPRDTLAPQLPEA